MDATALEPLRRVFSRHGVTLALLFGSQARGDARAASDFDFAIRGDGVDRLALSAELSREVGREVDVVHADTSAYALRGELLRESVVVYEREYGAAASWRTRALLEHEADGPCLERMQSAYIERCAARRLAPASQRLRSDGL